MVDATLTGLFGRLPDVMSGFEPRPGQMAMARAVTQCFEESRPLFVEAGTGTGKTLAYLLPAALSGKRIVISTATRALQEQIADKDIPLLQELLGDSPVRVAVMKGLSNYVCKRRLQEAMDANPNAGLVKLGRASATSESGDRAQLGEVTDEVWNAASSSTDTRIGTGCTYFDECFVTRMRRAAEEADLIIVNHHLFFADLALKSGPRGAFAGVIPPYDGVVFDEAHQIEDIVTLFFGSSVSSMRVKNLAEEVSRALSANGVSEDDAERVSRVAKGASDAFFAQAPKSADGKKQIAPNALDARMLSELQRALSIAEFRVKESVPGEAGSQLERRLHDTLVTLNNLRDPDPAYCVWVEDRERSVTIGMSPVNVGPTLKDALFERQLPVVCTSATLTTGSSKSFSFIRSRLGAPDDGVLELCVESPFDFERQAFLYLAPDLPEPSDPGFEDKAAERAIELIELTNGGAFVLCTSVRSMRAFHKKLRAKWGERVLLQGVSGKHLLLERFRSMGNAILVATMSFWEGVDVPGAALRLVIMDKIPFAVPTDPVVMARSAFIDQEGGNSFSQYALPQAAITLKQGFGRLIRSTQDRGIVALLDRRMVKKGYGKVLQRSLPKVGTSSLVEDVRRFWERENASSFIDQDGAQNGRSAT